MQYSRKMRKRKTKRIAGKKCKIGIMEWDDTLKNKIESSENKGLD